MVVRFKKYFIHRLKYVKCDTAPPRFPSALVCLYVQKDTGRSIQPPIRDKVLTISFMVLGIFAAGIFAMGFFAAGNFHCGNFLFREFSQKGFLNRTESPSILRCNPAGEFIDVPNPEGKFLDVSSN